MDRREYTGCTVNFKTYTNSIWDKKQRDNPIEKQAIFSDTYERIIEDNVFIGGNCGIYEGTIVRENAVIATGVIINSSTAIFDATTGEYIRADETTGQMVVPAGAVVVAGSRPITKGPGAEKGVHIYTPVIVKYRDEKTAASVVLEDLLR